MGVIVVILAIIFYGLIMKVTDWLLVNIFKMNGGDAGAWAMFWPILFIVVLIIFQILRLLFKALKYK